ncbi:MAG: precorrin-3B synthase [Stellaceae bacterium]
MAEPSTEIAAAAGRRGRVNGACPGLFRIVAARDGGLCRVRLPLGQLSAAQLRTIAGVAARCGNGIIEATNRANLQLRGVRGDVESAVADGLVAAGLGPARPETDDLRNIMISPTAGIDRRQQSDIRPLARALLALLERSDRHPIRSAKFGVLVDGGESIAAVDRPHDIWLASFASGAKIALGIDGSPPTEAADATPFVVIDPGHAVAAVAALLALFDEATADDPSVTRFRHVLTRTSRTTIFERLAGRLPGTVERAAHSWRRPLSARRGHIGLGDQIDPGVEFIGAVPPLGRLSPAMLGRIADIAEGFGDGDIRLTPWQSIILPSVPRNAAPDAVTALEQTGLICDRQHPLAAIVACAGSTGCARALSDTKTDALELARAIGPTGEPPRTIHLSGCARACACAGIADATLLASAPGRYELFAKAPGAASRFGRCIAVDLSVAQAAARLSEPSGRVISPGAGE